MNPATANSSKCSLKKKKRKLNTCRRLCSVGGWLNWPDPRCECRVKSGEISVCAEQREKGTCAYVIAVSPVKRGKTLNKFGKKVPISSSRLTHEVAQLQLEFS